MFETTSGPDLELNHPLPLKFISIPAGEFVMGSDPERDAWALADEQPAHPVHLSRFYISTSLITNAQYAQFLRANPRTARPGLATPDPNAPATYLNWKAANEFCEWLRREAQHDFHLPTEAQWERWARGPAARLYPWGDSWPITSFSPEFSMVEWCADWYAEDEYRLRAQSGRPTSNPQGPANGQWHVVRSHAFPHYQRYARCACRFGHYPRHDAVLPTETDSHDWLGNFGFRVVMMPRDKP